MDANTLQLWNVLGTWVASIGTVSAVITSLWLAYSRGRVKLKVTAGHRQIVSQGSSEIPDYCMIAVVNVGLRPAKIVSVCWEAGHFKNKMYMHQIFGMQEFDNVPKILQEGEEAKFMVPFRCRGNNEDWIVRFPKTLNENGKNRIKSLKVVVQTSVGQAFKVKVERNLIKKLEDSLQTNGQHKS